MAGAEDITTAIAFKTVVAFVGAPLSEASIKGRWVWGKPPTAEGPGAIHIQVYPKDPQVVTLAMQSINADDMRLGSKERQAVYRRRCVAIAKEINDEITQREGLSLLLKRDGTPTRKLIRYIRDWTVRNAA